MRIRSTISRIAATALALALLPSPGQAQQDPPPPLPLEPVEFPDFREFTLSNGARVVVVTNDEVPFVTVNLVIRGGTAADPEGREGTASMVAQLLTQGTADRTHEEIAEAMDFLGASLGAGAGRDEISVNAGAVTGALDDALEVMADVVMNPSFPEDRLELIRTQGLSGLQVALSQAATVAARAFTRSVYGDHPYGKLETPATLSALTRDDLVAFHRAHFAPGAALFVVAGDMSAEDAEARLEAAFGEWSGSGPSLGAYPRATDRAATEVILVHKPGSVQAEVRAGHLLDEGSNPEWTALAVGNQVLGGSASGRLFKVLREERGYTYGAYSSLSRARGQGYFQASMAVRNEVVEEAVTEMVRQVSLLRDQPIPSGELEDTKAFMVGSFPLTIETPQQVAGRVASNRLLGLPEDALETYRSRVAALDPVTVQEVFRRHVDTGRMAIVVVGDAGVLLDQLTSFGPIRLEDVEGNPLDASALEPASRPMEFSGEGLESVSLSYQVAFQDQVVGTTDRTLQVNPDGTMVFASRAELGPQIVEQEVVVRSVGLEFMASDLSVSVQGQTMGGQVLREGDRLVGTLTSPVGSNPVDMEAPEGVVVSDMLELALWVADLEPGMQFELPMANIQAGTVENVSVTVVEATEVTVPAGTFPVFLVHIGGSESQTLWLRQEAPHIVIRLEPASQPVAMELTAVEAGGDGPAGR